MVSRRYGAQVLIRRSGNKTLNANEIRYNKDKLFRQVGEALIGELVNQGPVVLDTKMVVEPDIINPSDIRCSIICDLSSVEHCQTYLMHDVPPIHLTARPVEKPVIEWQCGYCGQINLLDAHLECRRCGAPRRPMR